MWQGKTPQREKPPQNPKKIEKTPEPSNQMPETTPKGTKYKDEETGKRPTRIGARHGSNELLLRARHPWPRAAISARDRRTTRLGRPGHDGRGDAKRVILARSWRAGPAGPARALGRTGSNAHRYPLNPRRLASTLALTRPPATGRCSSPGLADVRGRARSIRL